MGKASSSASGRAPPRKSAIPKRPAATIVSVWPPAPGTSRAVTAAHAASANRAGPWASVRAIEITAESTMAAAASSSPCSQPAPEMSVAPTTSASAVRASADGRVKPSHASEATELARPQRPHGDPELAGRRPRQQVRERHQLGEARVVEPASADDVLLPEVPDVGNRPAERGQAEPERDTERLPGRACYRDRPRLPQRLVAAGRRIGGASKDEEQVREPVQVHEHERVDVMLPAPRAASPARRGGRSCGRRAGARRPRVPPGRTKLRSSGSCSLKWSHSASSRVDHALLDAQALLHLQGDAQVGADVEQLVLDPVEGARSSSGQSPASTRPSMELSSSVVPNGADARIELRHPRAVAERCLALVAATRVDARQADGLVAGACHRVRVPAGRRAPRALRAPAGLSRDAGSRSCPRRSRGPSRPGRRARHGRLSMKPSPPWTWTASRAAFDRDPARVELRQGRLGAARGGRWSRSQAARQSRRDGRSRIPTFMSASLNETPSNAPIGRPERLALGGRGSTLASRHPRASPTESAAMATRPSSRGDLRGTARTRDARSPSR